MPKRLQRVEQYVLMPARGMRASTSESVRFLGEAYSSMSHRRVMSPREASEIRMRVIDSIHEDGAKLVELTSAAALALRRHQPGLRLVPIAA
jgi:hypothetical protein